MLAFALSRADIASYVDAVFGVYLILILLYIILNILFSFGMRLPYSRWTDAILGFLRDVCEPYLGVFRKFIPPLGMFDFSPMIAIFLLIIVDRIVSAAIRG